MCRINDDLKLLLTIDYSTQSVTRTWARELSERCTVNAVNPGPVATDMYAASSQEFQMKMAGWTKNTPLAAIRPDVDRKDLIENAEIAGGRPVCATTRDDTDITDTVYRAMTLRLPAWLQCCVLLVCIRAYNPLLRHFKTCGVDLRPELCIC